MEEKVKKALAKISPALGGGMDVVVEDVSGGVVKLRLLMSGCATSLSKGDAIDLLEEHLTDEVPEIKEVVVE